MIDSIISPLRETSTPLEGVTTWRNRSNGFFCVDLTYFADPRKRSPEWVALQRRGMPKAEWEREYGSKWLVYDGKPVYDDYDEDIHLYKGNLYVPSRVKLVSGWDAGPNDVNLAWALALVFSGTSAIIIDEFYIDDGDTKGFVDIVHGRLAMEWFRISAGHSIHVADQSVFTKSGVADGKAVADIMRQRGMYPIPGEIAFSKRRRIVTELLTQTSKSKEGKMVPRLRIHERCAKAREAFGGGYAYPKAAGGVGGAYKPLPLKNEFSHIANAIEYICSRMALAAIEIPYEGRRLPASGVI